MHLIDKYSTLSYKQLRRQTQIQAFISYNFTNQIKKRLSQKYQQYISMIESLNQNESPLSSHQSIIGMVFDKQPGEFYDLQMFVIFNIETQIIQIRGHLCQHGIPFSLQSLNRIIQFMNMAANLNKLITPISIGLNPKTGAVYLQGNVYTEMGRQNDEMAIEMVDKIVFLITLMEQHKEILLYLIQEKMKISSSFLRMYPQLGNRLSEAYDLIASLQTSLFSMNLSIVDKNNFVNYERRRQQFFLQYQVLSEDVQKILSLYVSKQEVSTYKKLSKLSNEQYEDHQIQNCKDSVSRKIQSKILNRVYLVDKEQWIIWNCMSSGGYGKIEVADVKVYLPPSNAKFIEFQSKISKPAQEDLIEVRIIRKSDKRKIKDSRVVHQKQIVKNFKNKAHPNIATFLQVIPQRIKNLPNSEISSYLQNEKHLYLLFEVNTSLDSFMRKNLYFSLYRKVFTLEQAAKGLLFLHKEKIVHIDFKPANIFIGKHCLAKIGDFGESLLVGKIQQYTNATTFPYSPPQYNKHQPFLLTEKADVYSFGVTLFEYLFESDVKKPMQERYSVRKNSDNSYIQLPYIQPQKIKQYGNKRVISILSFLCLRCISVQSQQRPSMAWIVTVLQYCRFYLQLLMSK